MTLYFIGLGLADEKDITLKGLEAIKKCSKVFLETYTSVLQCSKEDLEKLYGKKIVIADRELVEKNPEEMLDNTKDVAFLVVGDPMSATTHIDLFFRAKEKGIKVEIIHNASIFSAIASTGLFLYKFGKTASIASPDKSFKPTSYYDVLKMNQKNEFHTLMLLDLKPDLNIFMTINEAIKNLLEIELEKKEEVFDENTFCVACARLGAKNQLIKVGKAKELAKIDYGKAPYCLIVPSKMHFMEEEALKQFE